jgi:hypothetical protein
MAEMAWPFQPLPGRDGLEAEAAGEDRVLRSHWARQQLAWFKRQDGDARPAAAPVLAQAIELAEDVRLIAIEGELVGELGNVLIEQAGPGLTFPLGYSNGTGLYLPSSRMIAEGGYEVESYYEYGFPAPLAPGMEAILAQTVRTLAAG